MSREDIQDKLLIVMEKYRKKFMKEAMLEVIMSQMGIFRQTSEKAETFQL